MAGRWNALGKQLGNVAKEQGQELVRRQAPKLMGRVQQSSMWDRALRAVTTPRKKPGPAIRPTSSAGVPSRERARQIVYSPQLDGRADPGEVVWTWVPYEEDPTNGKDRPVLVVGREGRTLLGLMLSSNEEHAHHPNWVGIGAGPWDHAGRASWVRLDRVLDVPEAGIRREGAILERKTFDLVAHRLCAEYHWH
ncbi:type II toxin-antitoxin system PemK/MazF family toxin [Nocardia huaxiensis]|uniref:Type II toxin-antitoxin system PemK/MazF family toxin n=1 Tax=Nocardia huaxiensis TaxID=2755382 RepID=A0A7D6ZG48_9NOCA|nr:type II toxin-antitoxin system PemK/MazF family toxin [Nocardia huaxiensis]QLY30139.1 type II toxin-antitoxin system PemK/MazF family toxin [Nocardia huaxiensis]UFS96249.1 type II toxin-antitoxin system PemK/MazF family toxin [Nocardia huaxiensis]